jgi:hypothetical protein
MTIHTACGATPIIGERVSVADLAESQTLEDAT